MPTSSEYQKVSCPSCGAPLPEGGPFVRCPYCGSVIEHAQSAQEGAAGQAQVDASRAAAEAVEQAMRTAQRAVPRARTAAGCVLSVTILVLIAAAAGVFMMARKEGPISIPHLVPLNRQVENGPILLPSPEEGPEDLLVFNYDSSNSAYLLSLVDGTQHTLTWDSPPLDSGANQIQPVAGGGFVFLVNGTTLMALNRSDGSQAWETTLSDSVISICQGCIRLANSYVVVLSQDGTLQGYEAQTGRAAWSERLNETPRNLWLADGKIAVLDKENPDEWDSVALQLRDPATGKVVRSINIKCTLGNGTEVPPTYDPNVLLSSDGKSAYFFYGLLPGCGQRWDLTTGQVVWEFAAEDTYFDRFNAPLFMEGGTIYGGYDGVLLAVDTAEGKMNTLLDEQDYDLLPLGVSENIVIVQAQRTRGSSRYELWGVDKTSGVKRWQMIMEESPIDSPGGWAEDAFAAHVTPRGLVVVHVLQEQNLYLLQTVDPQTGTIGDQASSQLSGSYWNGTTWSDQRVWLAAGSLYAVNLETGQIEYTWP